MVVIAGFPPGLFKTGDIIDLKEAGMHYKDEFGVVHRDGRMMIMKPSTLEAHVANLPPESVPEFWRLLKGNLDYFEVSMD